MTEVLDPEVDLLRESDVRRREAVSVTGFGNVYIRPLFQVLSEDHDYACTICKPYTEEGYWEGMQFFWNKNLEEFDTEWDPTIRF